ncbi:MAG: hypothetical protein IIA87_04915 [Nanoarchaeota archaeon]|nr:hypothetical protein [Nanoarchaeota archaeon]
MNGEDIVRKDIEERYRYRGKDYARRGMTVNAISFAGIFYGLVVTGDVYPNNELIYMSGLWATFTGAGVGVLGNPIVAGFFLSNNIRRKRELSQLSQLVEEDDEEVDSS